MHNGNITEQRKSLLRQFRVTTRAMLLGVVPIALLLIAVGLGVSAQRSALADVEVYDAPLSIISDAVSLVDALTIERDASLDIRLNRGGETLQRDPNGVSLMVSRFADQRSATDAAFKQLKRSFAAGGWTVDADELPVRIASARITSESNVVTVVESQRAYDDVINDLIAEVERAAPAPPQAVSQLVKAYLALVNAHRVASAENRSIQAFALTSGSNFTARAELRSNPENLFAISATHAEELTYLRQFVSVGTPATNDAYVEMLSRDEWTFIRDARSQIINSQPSLEPLATTVTLAQWQTPSAARLDMLRELRNQQHDLTKQTLARAIDAERSALVAYLGFGVSGALLLLIGVVIFARSLTKPMAALHSAATALSRGRIHLIRDTGNDELSVVAHAFARLHDQMSGLWSDAHNVRVEVEAGRQGARIDASRYDGDWNNLVSGFNDTLHAGEVAATRLKAEIERRTCLSEVAELALAANDAGAVARSAIDRLAELDGVAGCFLAADPSTDMIDPALDAALPSRNTAFDGNLAMFTPVLGPDGPLGRLVLVWDGPLHEGEVSATERTLEAAARMIAQTYRRDSAETLVRFQANHDLVTGLPNAQVFESWINTKMADGSARPIAVVALHLRDLGRSRRIGGQRLIDVILRQSAERLREASGFEALVARSEADHFLIGLESTPDPQPLADRLAAVLREPILDATGAVELKIGTGFSLATSPASARFTSREAVAAAAEAASIDATSAIRFSSALQERLDRHRRLELWFDQAITSPDMLTLWYQPIVSATDGAIVGYEALARGFDYAGNAVGPADFVPVIEESDRIHELGQFTSQRAVNDLAKLPGDNPYVAINVSPHEVHRGDLLARFDQLDWNRNARSRLAIEITEGLALIDDAPVMDTLRKLRDRGHRIIIDDFGSGYSSLGYLTRLPVSIVKLDRILIAEIDLSDKQYAIAAGAIEMAKAAGLTVVAEGVERASQLEVLRGLECDLIQGHLTGPPAPPTIQLEPSAGLALG